MTEEDIKQWLLELKLRIRKTGMTQKDFAKKSGVPYDTLMSYIRGKHINISVVNYFKIERELNNELV